MSNQEPTTSPEPPPIDWQQVAPRIRATMDQLPAKGRALGLIIATVVLIMGGCVYLVSQQWIALLAFGIVALVLVLVFIGNSRHSATGNPLVLIGQVTRKERKRALSSQRTVGPRYQHALHLDVTEAFTLTATGAQLPRPDQLGSRRLPTSERIYERATEHSPIQLVCTAAGLPIGLVVDYLL